MLSRFILENCCTILYLKVAHDSKHLIIIVRSVLLDHINTLGYHKRLSPGHFDCGLDHTECHYLEADSA